MLDLNYVACQRYTKPQCGGGLFYLFIFTVGKELGMPNSSLDEFQACCGKNYSLSFSLSHSLSFFSLSHSLSFFSLSLSLPPSLSLSPLFPLSLCFWATPAGQSNQSPRTREQGKLLMPCATTQALPLSSLSSPSFPLSTLPPSLLPLSLSLSPLSYTLSSSLSLFPLSYFPPSLPLYLLLTYLFPSFWSTVLSSMLHPSAQVKGSINSGIMVVLGKTGVTLDEQWSSPPGNDLPSQPQVFPLWASPRSYGSLLTHLKATDAFFCLDSEKKDSTAHQFLQLVTSVISKQFLLISPMFFHLQQGSCGYCLDVFFLYLFLPSLAING